MLADRWCVGVAVTQAAEDSAQLLPAVDRVEQRLKKKPQQMVADGSYTTRENIEKMAGREIDFVGSMGREEMPSGATAPNRLPPSAFLYQPETNHYLCPEGKLLRPQGRFNRKNKRGFVAYRYEAKISDCAPCIRKPECCPENHSGGRGLLRRVENAAILAFREKMASRDALGLLDLQLATLDPPKQAPSNSHSHLKRKLQDHRQLAATTIHPNK